MRIAEFSRQSCCRIRDPKSAIRNYPPAMSTETRNTRKTLVGVVTNRSGDKSIKVTIPFKVPHPRYKKVINRQTVLHVHDEKNETNPGDKVEVMETRPISRLKRWRVINVVERAIAADGLAITETDVAASVPTKTTKA
jgi:small subunit ribosomal protein S17